MHIMDQMSIHVGICCHIYGTSGEKPVGYGHYGTAGAGRTQHLCLLPVRWYALGEATSNLPKRPSRSTYNEGKNQLVRVIFEFNSKAYSNENVSVEWIGKNLLPTLYSIQGYGIRVDVG